MSNQKHLFQLRKNCVSLNCVLIILCLYVI